MKSIFRYIKELFKLEFKSAFEPSEEDLSILERIEVGVNKEVFQNEELSEYDVNITKLLNIYIMK